MSAEQSIEVTGETIEEAIAQGLEILGARASDVIVDILEEPVEGVFGMESRPARVRLEVLKKGPSTSSESISTLSRNYEESTPIVIPTGPMRSEKTDELPSYMDIEIDDGENASVPFLSDTDEIPESDHDDEAAIGKVVLSELLERMGIRARIIVKRGRPSDNEDSTPWILDVTGGNSNRLIGKRGDTLAALQYITRLITSRELQRRSEVIVDVDGYKSRRARQLHALALRLAGEASERHRVVQLEPMPPHERRIIHLALRGRDDVSTKSIGEGSGRKVTIVPKEAAT